MGTQLAFGSGDPISFLFSLIIGVMMLGALAFIAFLFVVEYWRRILAVGCGLLVLQGILTYVNSPEAKYERCIKNAATIWDTLDCDLAHPRSKTP